MSRDPEFIGRARVLHTEEIGGLVIKQLAPEMVGRPIEPGTPEAQAVIDRMKPREKTDEEKVNYKPKAPRAPYTGNAGGRMPE